MSVPELTVSADLVEINDRLLSVLSDASDELGLKAVYYGDRTLIPDFPSACLTAMGLRRNQLDTHRFGITYTATILVYYGKVQEQGVNRRDADVLAMNIQDKLHEDFTLGGTVIFGHVTEISTGVTRRASAMILTSALTWMGISRENF